MSPFAVARCRAAPPPPLEWCTPHSRMHGCCSSSHYRSAVTTHSPPMFLPIMFLLSWLSCGKSVGLATIAQQCRAAGWIVACVPDASAWCATLQNIEVPILMHLLMSKDHHHHPSPPPPSSSLSIVYNCLTDLLNLPPMLPSLASNFVIFVLLFIGYECSMCCCVFHRLSVQHMPPSHRSILVRCCCVDLEARCKQT